jgi:hypothetical protein
MREIKASGVDTVAGKAHRYRTRASPRLYKRFRFGVARGQMLAVEYQGFRCRRKIVI